MQIDIITLFPELLSSPFEASILKRAIAANKVVVNFHNLRDYATDKQKQVDDYPFGGGAGMVMKIEPIDLCIKKLKSERAYDEIIYLTPDGEQLNQNIANTLSTKKNIILLCGHYKGVDQRVRDHLITREISIGDFVLSGVLGDESSALTDSFQDGILAPPIYTRPAQYMGWNVPPILTSGNTPAVEKWREDKAIEKTKAQRPDLLTDKD
jgi:tRNA (guanine37-N1)-methyltransferase